MVLVGVAAREHGDEVAAADVAGGLGELDGEARTLVGEVLMRNFGLVRDRLRNMILRADVGITQQAWEVREDQITRVRTLQRERTMQERVLREELDVVLDDAGESTDAPASGGGDGETKTDGEQN